jgi:ABC-type glycerol-3-phosphate transport system permease component
MSVSTGKRRRLSIGRIRPGQLALELLVTLLCLAWLSPFYLLIVNTFKTMPQISASPVALPQSLSLDAYARAWKQAHLGEYYKNSLIISAVSVVLSVGVSSLAAYAFSRLRFFGKQALLFFILAGVMLPLQVVLVPLYRLASLSSPAFSGRFPVRSKRRRSSTAAPGSRPTGASPSRWRRRGS